jgi:hypothetical protein
MSSILFCTPCYGGMVLEPHFRSCLQLKEDLTEMGVAHDWLTGKNESLVHRARMEMAKKFLDSSHTHMMWLDADIEFTTDDVGKLWNLCDAGADIAVGIYCMKKRDEQWFAAWMDGKLVKDLDQFGSNPIEVDYAGTGFMMIKRHVLETLAEQAEKYEGPAGMTPALFMTPIKDGVLLSEDYYFCLKAREAGFKIIADPTVRLIHWGQFGYGAGQSQRA